MSDLTRLELMMLFAAGALDADEAEAVRAMIASGDPGALADLAHAEAVLAQIPEALPMAEVPKRAKQVLRDRLSAANQTVAATPTPKAPPASPSPRQPSPAPSSGVLAKLRPWLAAAVFALLAGGAVWMVMSSRVETTTQQLAALQNDLTRKEVDLRAAREQAESARQTIRALEGEAAQRVGQIARLEGQLNQSVADAATLRAQTDQALAQLEAQREDLSEDLTTARQTLMALATPTGRAVILPGTELQRGGGARLVYDPPKKQALVFAHDIRQPPAGQTYQLWVVTADDRKVSLGTFEPDADGNVAVRFDLPNDPGQVLVAAVTNEPLGGSPQPTGDFQLVGEF